MSKRGENGEVAVAGGRAFDIMQYKAKPFSRAWRKDRVQLVKNAKPLITDEQIEDGLRRKTITRYAYIWHDRCSYTEEEAAEDETGRIVEGEPKFAHVHIAIQTSKYVTVDVVARWFGVPVNYVNVLKGRGAFLDYCDYLLHETSKAVAAGKTHYEADEAICSEGFDLRAELDTLHENRRVYGAHASRMTAVDVMRAHVLHDGWSMRQCREDDSVTYTKIRSSLPPLRLDYLLDADPCPFRMNIYVDGGSGLGKSQFSDAIAEALFPDWRFPAFHVGNDERVSFDGYDGEPVVIWDDMRAVDFISKFHRGGTLRLLDNHPKKDAQQAKHSRVILTNAVNIINGIEPYERFMAGLAGEYVGSDGRRHTAEDDTQIYRRMPLIIRVQRDDFDLLVNQGFLDNDLYAVKQFTMHRRVAGSIKAALDRLEGEAYTVSMGKLTAPVVETVRMIEAAHDNKISDPALIPDEFAHYGEVMTGEDMLREYETVFAPLWAERWSLIGPLPQGAIRCLSVRVGEMENRAFRKRPTFDQWVECRCPNSWDEEHEWFCRSDEKE